MIFPSSAAHLALIKYLKLFSENEEKSTNFETKNVHRALRDYLQLKEWLI